MNLRIDMRVGGAFLGLWTALAGATLQAREAFTEDFASDPLASGWAIAGDASLFQWDPAGQSLSVTWDSSRTNSYFHRRLPSVVTAADDFTFGFDLQLSEHAVGIHPGKPGTFQIALGLIRLADATAPDFQRGVFLRSRNLVEWSWFGTQPDGAISASLSPAVVPADGRLPWGYSDTYRVLETGVRYGFELGYTATNRTLRIQMTIDGELAAPPTPVVLPRNFTGFRVDALSIHSYSDAGQDPLYAGSVRATGKIDQVRWSGPGPAVDRLRYEGNDLQRRVVLWSRRGWRYQLKASGDLKEWDDLGAPVDGTGGELTLEDLTKLLAPQRYYRVEAFLP